MGHPSSSPRLFATVDTNARVCQQFWHQLDSEEGRTRTSIAAEQKPHPTAPEQTTRTPKDEDTLHKAASEHHTCALNAHPASERCKHVGQPQNPSPPSTTIFFDGPAAMNTSPDPEAAAVGDRLLREARRVLDQPDVGREDAVRSGTALGVANPTKEDDKDVNPSVEGIQRVSATRVAQRVVAIIQKSFVQGPLKEVSG